MSHDRRLALPLMGACLGGTKDSPLRGGGTYEETPTLPPPIYVSPARRRNVPVTAVVLTTGQGTAPTTAQRPKRQRRTTAARRPNMNIDRPVQIPVSPQPKASEIQIIGRNPIPALTSVAVRRNAASPAPSSTPSSANTTPATGCSATKNH